MISLSKKKGFSIVQIMVVLGIFAALSISGYNIYSSKMDQIIVKEIIDDFLNIKNAVIEHYIDEMSYEGLTEEYAFAQGIYPSTMQMNYESGKCTTRLNLRCKLRVLDESNGASMFPEYLASTSGFTIVLSPVLNDYCYDLVTELSKHFEFVDIGNQVVKSYLVSHSYANTDSVCKWLDENVEDGNSRVRVGHY